MSEDQGLTYLFAAYTVIWVVLLGYVARLRLHQRALERQIQRLEERTGAVSGAGPGGPVRDRE
ncbi:MAG: CcmD family protein [Gemmatimonadota bacterium]